MFPHAEKGKESTAVQMPQEHIAALCLMAANVDDLGALDPRKPSKCHCNAEKAKDISIMKQKTGVFLQVNSLFRVFLYQAFWFLLTCLVTVECSSLSIKVRAKQGTELCACDKEFDGYILSDPVNFGPEAPTDINASLVANPMLMNTFSILPITFKNLSFL